MDNLIQLAELIKVRNSIGNDIAALIGRPAQIGHVGEYIASAIFNISLEESATHKGSDGYFIDEPLVGKSVNIKWYGKQEGILDINPNGIPDYFLVLTGPKSVAPTSRGSIRPWIIESVFLINGKELIDILHERGVKVGIATSVIKQLWEGAEIYPQQRNNTLILSNEQCNMLDLFH